MKKHWPLHAIHIGILFLLLGIQMFAIDTYVLTPTATRVLSKVTVPSSGSANGKLQDFVVNSTGVSHNLDLPDWLSWGTACAGAVLIIHGVSQARLRKKK
ncbi:MAG: hypothetical protein ACKVH8_22225 [Pirellulales bacterium]